MQIIDFSFGHTGSTHDASAWEATRLAQDREELMEENEWVWADSAYPVSAFNPIYFVTNLIYRQINTWIIAPYKAPERNHPDNEIFNNHVSILRIRSEHAIGFLKGRFQSLKNLRVHIKDRITHVIGTYWVAACIGIHAFAVRHEAEEKHQDPDFDELADNPDPFIDEGLTTTSESDSVLNPRVRIPTRLQLAKRRREKLKEKLFRSKVKKTRRIAQERRNALGADISSSESL